MREHGSARNVLSAGTEKPISAEAADTARGLKQRREGYSAETAAATAATATRRRSMPELHLMPKSGQALARILAAVEANAIFARLNEEQIQLLQQAMTEQRVAAGTCVINQGEKGDHFYIVDSGTLEAKVVRSKSPSVPGSPASGSATGSFKGEQITVKEYGAGESFGELALMYNGPRAATVLAVSDCVLWSLDRVTFRSIVIEANTRNASMYEAFLEKVALLSPLTKEQRNRMVDALEEVTYRQGEVIIEEGSAGQYLYIIVDGEVKVSKGGEELVRRKSGDYLGEASLTTGEPTIASVSACSNVCKLVRLGREQFNRLLGPLDSLLMVRTYDASGKEILEESQPLSARAADDKRINNEVNGADKLESLPTPLVLSDFSVTRGQLGEGAFATVRRCRHEVTGRILAMKQMCKADIVESSHTEHILQEAQILSQIHHPFVCNKIAAFATPGSIILVTELCPGGDLFDALHMLRRFSVSDTRIFSSQILLTLEYLHARKIVHRDLKLENLLLAQDGALKLTDFGFAKHIKYRSWTLCGTPEYLAPEIILEKGHGKAVDYWALGVLIYEMLTGHSPFEADDPLATYQKVIDGKIDYLAKMPTKAVSLTSKLLERDVSKRFGNLVDGAKDIKSHRFYSSEASFTWDNALTYRSSLPVPKFDAEAYDWIPAPTHVADRRPCAPDESKLFESAFGVFKEDELDLVAR